MRLHFLTSPDAESPAWSGDFDNPAALRCALVSDPATYYVAVDAPRGAVIVLAPSTRYRTVRGGLGLSMADTEKLWNDCETTRLRETALDAFLDGPARALTRRAVFPAPRLVAHEDSTTERGNE